MTIHSYTFWPLDVELNENVFFEYAYSFSLDPIFHIRVNDKAGVILLLIKSLILED